MHLQELKAVILADSHPFYDCLPFTPQKIASKVQFDKKENGNEKEEETITRTSKTKGSEKKNNSQDKCTQKEAHNRKLNDSDTSTNSVKRSKYLK